MKCRIPPAYYIVASLLALSLLFSPLIWPSQRSSSVNAAPYQARRRPQTDLRLSIDLRTDFSDNLISVFEGRTTLHTIRRESLNVVNPQLAGDFTAVDIWAQKQTDTIRVRLALVFNDLSDQQWRKNRKEKIVGEYLIPRGQSVYATELAQYGIDPFEMKAVTDKPVVLRPGEGPPIINNTAALEVVKLEKWIDRYELTLRNSSGKNVVAINISFGNTGRTASRVDYGAKQPLIPPGGLYLEDELLHRHVDGRGIVIKAIFFDDGTFEGDEKIGLALQAGWEGVRIQAPHILRIVEQTLMQSTDADLEKALYELEARLWKIPEAIDKKSALEFLRTKYPALGDEVLESLYERLKQGLYQARDMALVPLGDLKRQIEDQNAHAGTIRQVLTELKEDFEKLINKLQETPNAGHHRARERH